MYCLRHPAIVSLTCCLVQYSNLCRLLARRTVHKACFSAPNRSMVLLTSSSILLDSSLLLRVPHDLEQNPLAVVQENSQIPAGASSAQEDPLGLGMPKHSSVTTNFPSTGLVPLDLKQGEGRRWRLQCLALARFPLSLGDGSRPSRWPPPASRRPRAPLWASCSVLRWCAP